MLAGCMVGIGIVAGAAGGCGGDRSSGATDRADAVEAVRGLRRAYLDDDRRRVCALMGGRARRQAGAVAHGRQGLCRTDLAEAFAVVDGSGGMRASRRSKPLSASVDGDTARVAVDIPGHGRVGVPLTRQRGGWRLDSFFGVGRADADAAIDAAGPARPAPPRRVNVSEASDTACVPLFADRHPELAGGCVLHGSARRLRLAIGTAFGSFRFGRCELRYRVLLGANGRAWIDSVEFRGPGNVNNGCSDVRACDTADGRPIPWPGWLSSAGPGHLRQLVEVCLDTCIGVYAGPLELELSQRGGWRAAAANAPVGHSGLRLAGRIALDAPAALSVTPAADRSRP